MSEALAFFEQAWDKVCGVIRAGGRVRVAPARSAPTWPALDRAADAEWTHNSDQGRGRVGDRDLHRRVCCD
jgi:hypothetical protein